MRCFLDFKPGGSLCHIFANIYRFNTNQCRSKELNVSEIVPEDEERYKEMSIEVFQKLIDQKCFRLPSVYIRSEIDDDMRNRIIGILKQKQCEITEDADQASHIIYPEVDHFPEDYARLLFKRGKNVMIHWYYLPETYDSWIPITFDLPVRNII